MPSAAPAGTATTKEDIPYLPPRRTLTMARRPCRSWHCEALSTIRLAEANRACRCPPVRDCPGFPCPFRRRAMLNSRPAAATAAATGRGAPAGRIDPGQCDRPVRNRPAERRKIVKVRRKFFGPLVMGAALGLAGLATQVLGAARPGRPAFRPAPCMSSRSSPRSTTWRRSPSARTARPASGYSGAARSRSAASTPSSPSCGRSTPR